MVSVCIHIVYCEFAVVKELQELTTLPCFDLATARTRMDLSFVVFYLYMSDHASEIYPGVQVHHCQWQVYQAPSLALVLQATKVAVTVCGYDLWPMAPVPFLRASVDRSVPQGAKVTTSEQLQPVYETKNLVQQNSKQLEGIELHLKVRVWNCWLLVCCSLVPSVLLCRGGAWVWKWV